MEEMIVPWVILDPKEVDMATLTEVQRWDAGVESLANGQVARALGEALPHGGVVAIHGAMGAGKTTLVRQLLASWNVEEEGASPTFGLVHHHAVHREGGAKRSDTWTCTGWKTKKKRSVQASQKC